MFCFTLHALKHSADVIAKRQSPPSDTTTADSNSAYNPIIHNGFAIDGTTSLTHSAPTTVIGPSTKAVTTPKPKRPIKKRKVEKTPSKKTPTPPNKKMKVQRQSNTTNTTPLTTTDKTTPDAHPAISPEQEQLLTSRAKFLSQTIESEPGLYRAILLHMALEREAPRKPGGGAPDHKCPRKFSPSNNAVSSASVASVASVAASPNEVSIGHRRGNQYVEGVSTSSNDGSSKIITNGFFWKDLPELEAILQQNMEEYYEMR